MRIGLRPIVFLVEKSGGRTFVLEIVKLGLTDSRRIVVTLPPYGNNGRL